LLTCEKIFKETNNFTNANNLKTNTSINTIINNSKIGLKNHPKTYLNSISFTITSTNNSLINNNNNNNNNCSNIKKNSDFRLTNSQSSNNEINFKLANHHHYNSKLGRSFSFKLNEN
jgi:hypothetical protein